MTRRRLPRFARFVIVGAGGAALLFGASLLFASLGLAPFAGGLAAYAVAFAAAYAAQRSWTFGATQRHGRALPRYLAVQALCALVAALASHVAAGRFGLSPPLVAAAATLAASMVGFVLSARWAFAPPPDAS